MSKAFTLIELLIVIAIITVMAVIAVPAFNTYGARAEIEAKAEEIKVAIDKAYAFSQAPEQGTDGVNVTIGGSDFLIKSEFCKMKANKSDCSGSPIRSEIVSNKTDFRLQNTASNNAYASNSIYFVSPGTYIPTSDPNAFYVAKGKYLIKVKITQQPNSSPPFSVSIGNIETVGPGPVPL